MSRFILDGRYGAALERYGIRVEEALRKAGLPGDAFRHKTPTMKEDAPTKAGGGAYDVPEAVERNKGTAGNSLHPQYGHERE